MFGTGNNSICNPKIKEEIKYASYCFYSTSYALTNFRKRIITRTMGHCRSMNVASVYICVLQKHFTHTRNQN